MRKPVALATLLLWLEFVGPAPAATGPPQVVHEQTIVSETERVETICGDVAVFDYSGTHSFTLVGMSQDVFTWTAVDRSQYTVTFEDPSLGVWEGRFTQSETVHATPGGTFVFSFVINDRAGPVRIRETTTFVVGPDGTIRVQNETFDVTGCPST